MIAGSVVEALLWWGLTEVYTATGRAAQTDGLKRDMLNALITKAMAESLVTPETESLARLAQDYRNLIHQGRAQRLAQAFDRGTARTTLGAVYAIDREFGERTW